MCWRPESLTDGEDGVGRVQRRGRARDVQEVYVEL